MSFILKDDPTILNIKLTDKGREQLAKGKLTFTKFSVGDSEIDYSHSTRIGSTPFNTNILLPKDNNKNFISFIEKTVSATTYQYDLKTAIPVDVATITNTATPRGFFSSSSGYTYQTDTAYVKQANMVVDCSSLDGTSTLTVEQDSNYGPNQIEPVIGDYILINFANPLLSGNTGYNVENSTPILWYKVLSIQGTLQADNLLLELDRNLPDFAGQGSNIKSQVLLYPNSNDRTVSGDSVQNYYGQSYVTDFLSQAYLSFFENCNSSDLDVPVWNMHIVFTENFVGSKAIDKNIEDFESKEYGGFVSYIQEQNKTYDSLGVIHFTNKSPNNIYGEGFLRETPKLILPTIMWHKNNTIGLELTPINNVQYLEKSELKYQDLADQNGNVVGKVFLDLKLFVIEDQELLFAMSYKSNRNWTLPNPEINFNIIRDCP